MNQEVAQEMALEAEAGIRATGDFRALVEGLDHPEGVVWDSDRGVVYAGGEAGQIYEIPERGGAFKEIARAGEDLVLGLALDRAGRIYACAGPRVVRVDPLSGDVTVYSTGTPDLPMRLPNFGVFGPDGTLFVTDSGSWGGDDGVIYGILPDGTTELWESSLSSFPNGACLTPEEDALYVLQSQSPGVWRVGIADDGSATEPAKVCDLPGTVPDGLALDDQGRIYIGCYRPDRLYRVDPADPRPAIVVDDPEGTMFAGPTNLAFIGEGLDTLVTANLGRWHLSAGEVGAVGRPVPRPEVD